MFCKKNNNLRIQFCEFLEPKLCHVCGDIKCPNQSLSLIFDTIKAMRGTHPNNANMSTVIWSPA